MFQLGDGPLTLWAVGIAALTSAVASAIAVYGSATDAEDLAAIAVLGVLAFIAERQPVRITGNAEVTVSALPVLFAAVVFGPLAAMAVGALGLLGDCKAPYTRWVIWTSSRSLSGGMAGLAFIALSQFGNDRAWLFVGVAAAVAVDAVLDVALNAVTVAIRKSGSFFGFLTSGAPVVAATLPFHSTVVALLAYAYVEVAAWTMLLFFGPAFAAHRFYRLYREEREASGQLQAANEKLERASLSFARALVSALDARDQYTAGHSAAVAVYARDIAERLGLDEKQIDRAHLCGLLHDIGKVGLPPGLLEKPGRLSLTERRKMEEHSAIGERILRNVEDYRDIATIVRHHHERVDGNGYPDGLALEEIPLISRIVAVADAYNAMTSGRPYRDAMESNVARLRLAHAVGTQFDISVVAAFEAVLASSGETYRSGAHADFSLEAQRHPALEAVAAVRAS